jgi:hypothetical protein
MIKDGEVRQKGYICKPKLGYTEVSEHSKEH